MPGLIQVVKRPTYLQQLYDQGPTYLQVRVRLAPHAVEGPEQHSHVSIGHTLLCVQLLCTLQQLKCTPAAGKDCHA
jgi:hypothetical protein